MDIVGPLPADRRHEFVIVFVDCFSRYTVLVPASNHTADTVSEALLRHVVPYFGTPRRLLSDRETGVCWGSLGEIDALSRDPEAIDLSLPPRGQFHQ